MAGDDDIIDEAVVRIGPDLKGFRRKLERELKTQLSGVNLEIPVKINESKQREALNYVAGLRAKYVKEELARTRNAAEKVGQAQDQARQHELKQVRSFTEAKTKVHIQAQEYDLKQVRTFSEAQTKLQIQAIEKFKAVERKKDVDRQRKDEEYLTFQQKVNSELAKMAQARADDEISIRHDTQNSVAKIEREGSRLRIAVLAAEEKVEKEHLARTEKAEKESISRRNKANANRKKFFRDTPQLIDFGGKGIRPMNILYGVVTAMTPALFAMGASAVQASTSIAALGSAGIGAALGLTGVLVAFQGIGDLLSLRKQVLNEQTTGAANAARNATLSADDLAQAKRSLADAHRDEKTAEEDLHKARREAIRDLEDLKQAVVDLDNQYKSDTLSVAEARQNAVATDQNFFATALDRARAWQDVRDAETQQKDTALQRKQKQQDLKSSLAGGIEKSDRVKQARERVRDARDRTLDAQAALRRQSSSTAAGIDKVSSASAQLKKKLAEMSPAARDMYYWFERNEGLFKRLQNQISQQVLPGFTKFLKAVTAAPKGGKSTLQLAAEYAGELGAIISKYAGLFGEWTKSPLFRTSMARIQTSNAKAFDKLGDAALTLAKPLLRIVDKASPGFESLADWVLKLTQRFDKWIEQLDESGELTKWFEESRIELGKWYDILSNIGEIFTNIFSASLPAGSSLVTNFRDLTETLADWTSSTEGRKALTEFFTTIRDLPYAKIIDFLKNAVLMFTAFRTLKFAYAHPFVAALTAFAAANPEAAGRAFSAIADAISFAVDTIVAHPEAAAAIITMLAAAKARKALGFDIRIPVISSLKDALTSKFKVLDKFTGGGATTGTMTVHAGVVNVYGKTLGAAVGGIGGGVTGGAAGTDPKKKGKLSKIGTSIGRNAGGLTDVATIAALFFGADVLQRAEQVRSGAKGDKFQSIPDALLNKTFNPEAWYNAIVDNAPIVALAALVNKVKGDPKDVVVDKARTKAMGDEAYAMSRLKNNLSSFGKDSDVTKTALNDYISARRISVEKYVAYIRSTKGPIEAAKAQRAEDVKSQTELSKLLQKYGWSKAAAEVYTKQVFYLTEQTKLSKLANEENKVSYDSMGNALDKTITKTQLMNEESTTLKNTINGMVGNHVIALETKNYPAVKKQLDLLYATQHVLYNPTYSNSAAGADSISSQNQFLDPKTGLPKKFGKAAGGPIYGPGTGTSDSIPAWLSDGEYVMPAKTVDHYGLGFMEAMRRRQLPGYAKGGPVMPFIVNLPKKGFQFPETEYGAGPMPPQYTGPVPRGVGDIKGVMPHVIAATLGAKRAFPSLHVTSGLRRTHTSSGNKSNHWFGRAVDLVPPSMQLFNYLKSIYGKVAREIIYTPAGDQQVWHGRNHRYRAPDVVAGHYNHVHLALAQGGPVRARKYDRGGILPPGFTTVYNGTGRNETVRTARQEQNIQQGPLRLDRRDMALLANAVRATDPAILNMDGRRVAEVTNRYNYLPAGV